MGRRRGGGKGEERKSRFKTVSSKHSLTMRGKKNVGVNGALTSEKKNLFNLENKQQRGKGRGQEQI